MKKVTNPFQDTQLKIGILGGGQLGKMYCEAASCWDWNIWILDQQKTYPAGNLATHFVEGDFTNYDDVLEFGRKVDVLTIEIEKVNVDAIEQLESEGKIVRPSSVALKLIRDKGLQKQFYTDHDLPTSPFQLVDDLEAVRHLVRNEGLSYPFVLKARTGGYDGRGVAIIRNADDLDQALDEPSLIEELVDIEKEVSVIVVRNDRGEVKTFPPVAMEFHPTANLVEYLYSPSGIGPAFELEAVQIAQSVAEGMDIKGLLAVEMFLTRDGHIMINEVAPRPHNSGHHTIESCSISQYQMGLLAICDLPLPDITENIPAVMINVLGAEGYTGDVKYIGIEKALEMDNVHVHLYGKQITKPFRKMGHITVLDQDLSKAIEKATFVKQLIKVQS